MILELRQARSLSICLVMLLGCSSGERGPKVAPADGTVTYMGSPLAGATVIFVPAKGPVAMGVTDMNGKFKLATGTVRGAVIGPVKVSVTAMSADESKADMGAISKRPQSKEEADAYMKKAAEMQAAMASGRAAEVMPKSLIPEKYGKVETSGLAFEVKASGPNHFDITLTN